jgi:Tfp pilus assembly protein PilO
MNSKRLPIFVGIGVAVAVLLVLLILVFPRNSAVSKAQSDLDGLKAQETQLRTQVAALETLRTKAGDTQRKLDQNQTLIPPTADKPGLIRLLQLVADKTGVDLGTIQPSGATASTGGDYSTIPVNVIVSGTFFQIDEFLYRIERLPRAMKVTSVTIQAGSWPELTMTATLETYTTDTSAGPGSQPGHQGPVVTTPTAVPSPSPAA